MDGDTSGGLAPIAGIDKDFIRQWLVWAEKNLGYKSLRFVNHLSPSAELRPAFQAQTDEKDLMPYDILKEIEVRAIYQRLSPQNVLQALIQQYPEIAAEQLKEYVQKFYSMWSRNQWKRERLAPSFHLDEFSVDPRSWCRFPILSAGFEEELKALKV
jgi:NAD+ synthase (glutamine-hydrolysing)